MALSDTIILNILLLSLIRNLSTKVMSTSSSILSSPACSCSLGRTVDCLEHTLLITQEAKFCYGPFN